MSNLVEPLGEENMKIDEYIPALQETHDYLVARCREQTYSGDPKNISTFGQDVKRSKVNLDGKNKPAMIGAAAQSRSELENQLANIERLIDASVWARDNGATTVMQSNPTTSSKGHDLTVSGSGGVFVFEISDTIGKSSGKKIKKDLKTLFNCKCDYCRELHKSFLVVSEEASVHLPKGSYKISKDNFVNAGQVDKVSEHSTTYIAEFYR